MPNALKALAKTADTLRVGNYLALWGGRDLEGIGTPDINPDGSRGETFTPATEFESAYTATGRLMLDWEHGLEPDASPELKTPGRDDVLGYVDWATARKDERGLFVERVLNRRNAYVRWLEPLVEAGLIGTSSEAVEKAVEKKSNGEIVRWPLRRDTLTVCPMDPRMLSSNVVTALKALKFPLEQAPPPEMPKPAQTAPPAPFSQALKGTLPMNLLEKIKQLVPGLTEEQYAQIAAVIDLAMADPQSVLGETVSPEVEAEIMALPEGEYPTGKSLTRVIMLAAQKIGVRSPVLSAFKASPPQRPAYAGRPTPVADDNAESEQKAFTAAYAMRFGEDKVELKAVMTDLVGKDYQQQIFDQNAAYAKYLRHGDRWMELKEIKSLKSLIFPASHILRMIRDGYTVREIKTTMVEAQGILGGYAVPPNVSDEIITRLPGLTAVRGGGATVVQLVNSNSIQVPKYTGGDARYVGNLRGQWGSETQSPGEQNATLGLVEVPANVYTYKVPMSRSLVEDAANLVQLVNRDIGDTLAIDEDEAFLIEDGVGKPLGLLPGSANGNSLTEVNSGHASTLLTNGIKALKRGVASQYRQNGVFVGASDTYGDIEVLTVSGTGSDFAFPDLSDSDKLLGRRTFESEAMPAVAANAFPIIFGDMSGYMIVERMGLTIERFMDSNTGVNKVEFHVRRRIGGYPHKPWMFAVQKVAA